MSFKRNFDSDVAPGVTAQLTHDGKTEPFGQLYRGLKPEFVRMEVDLDSTPPTLAFTTVADGKGEKVANIAFNLPEGKGKEYWPVVAMPGDLGFSIKVGIKVVEPKNWTCEKCSCHQLRSNLQCEMCGIHQTIVQGCDTCASVQIFKSDIDVSTRPCLVCVSASNLKATCLLSQRNESRKTRAIEHFRQWCQQAPMWGEELKQCETNWSQERVSLPKVALAAMRQEELQLRRDTLEALPYCILHRYFSPRCKYCRDGLLDLEPDNSHELNQDDRGKTL